MEKYRFFRPFALPKRKALGFTLIEMMVTVALLVILAAMAAPSMQSWLTRSGMNTVQKDFVAALGKARAEAVARNACVSVCQLRANGLNNTCETEAADAGKWHQGWIIYENPTCASPEDDLVPAGVIQIRQPGNTRYTLNDDAKSVNVVFTYNARGVLRNQAATVNLADSQDALSNHARKLTVNMQGNVTVSNASVAAVSTAAGDKK